MAFGYWLWKMAWQKEALQIHFFVGLIVAYVSLFFYRISHIFYKKSPNDFTRLAAPLLLLLFPQFFVNLMQEHAQHTVLDVVITQQQAEEILILGKSLNQRVICIVVEA